VTLLAHSSVSRVAVGRAGAAGTFVGGQYRERNCR
jgi:hypothetical protein